MRKLSIKFDTSYALFADINNKPTNVSYHIFGENSVQFSDGSSEKGTCLNCLTPPCTYYSRDEMALKVLPEMPYNNNNRVCPTDAITLDDKGFPAIDQDQCIGCGLCFTRCPYGAIEWEGYKATIAKRDSDKYTWVKSITSAQFSGMKPFLRFNPSQISSRYKKIISCSFMMQRLPYAGRLTVLTITSLETFY